LGENEIWGVNQEENEVVFNVLLCLFVARWMCTSTQEFSCGFLLLLFIRGWTHYNIRGIMFSNFLSCAYWWLGQWCAL
jgi:hypothetical protein